MAIVQPAESSNGHRRLRLAHPGTAEVIGEIPVTAAAEVRAAVTRARAAQKAWAATSFAERARVMRTAVTLLLRIRRLARGLSSR